MLTEDRMREPSRASSGKTKEVIMKSRTAIIITSVFAIALAASALAVSCDGSLHNATTVTFNLTDAPVDSSTVKAVNIVVSSVSVNESADANPGEGSWDTTELSPALSVNLLSLQNGLIEEIGGIALTPGTQVNQIRLGVDSVTVVETDDSEHEATLPSATGFKIVNAFQVPLSGGLTVTIDFDVRKALVKNANGYLLKPAIRAIVDGEAGKITGNNGQTAAVAVYAYANDSYQTSEAVAGADGEVYQNAYSSTLVSAEGSYVLAFMGAGTYDLYAVGSDASVVGIIQDVVVSAGATTANQNFELLP